jgi:ABC-type lipoprotein export system ATPase subunit
VTIGATNVGMLGPSAPGDPVVTLRHVFCVHRTREGDAAALQGLSLELAGGQLLCVMGPSGAGKTTLLRVIAGLQTPSAGVVRVFGQDIGRLPARSRAQLRHDRIGFLTQHAEAALAPDLSVRQAVALPLALRGTRARAREARVRTLLQSAELEARADALPAELSGGERQRVALCAALAHGPQLLLADEPTAELDQSSAVSIGDLIARLAHEYGTTVLVVSHDPELAAGAQRVVALRDGRLVEDRDGAGESIAVGGGGWLRISPSLLADTGIANRARLRRVADGLLLSPPPESSAEGGPKTSAGSRPETSAEGGPESRAQTATPAGLEPRGPAPDREPDREPALVQLRAVSAVRGTGAARRVVLERLTLRIEPGRLTAVVGRSGAGKTTLLRILGGFDPPDEGELTIDGHSLSGWGQEALGAMRRARIGYLPQEPSPVGFLSVEENVVLALRLRGVDRARARACAAAVLAQLAIVHRSGQRLARLSAGESQRAALARALASAGGLLIVDEPTSRLDRATAEHVARVLHDAAATERQTVVCATHDPAVISWADQVIELPAGVCRRTESGPVVN